MGHYEGSDFIYDTHNVLGGSRRVDGTDKGWQDYKVQDQPKNKVISAKEAREQLEQLSAKKIDDELQMIFAKIEAAIKSEKDTITVYKKPPELVIKKLKELGYALSESENPRDQRDDYLLAISW